MPLPVKPHASLAHTGAPLPPAQGRVTIYDRDGTPLECFAVDARELLASGEYSASPPEHAAPLEAPAGEPELTHDAPEHRRRGRPPKHDEP